MKTGKKIAMIVLAVLPLVMVLAVYGKLPERVPMHWGIDGEIDRYGDKIELLPLAGLNLLFGLMMPFLAKVDPRKQNYTRFSGTYENMMLVLLGFLSIVVGVTLFETLHPGVISVTRVITGMVALLFILLGNMVPKVKSNFYTGIKTPWALSSDEVWNKTQRLGGKTFVFGGLLLLLTDIFLSARLLFIILMTVIVIICFVPTAASYLWYQQERREKME